MFTGIIEETGKVRAVRKGAKSAQLTIEADIIFDDLKIGDSVAANGVCLTVTSINGNTYTADVMNETLSRSSLGELRSGDAVNLERAMAANGRFGGHIVSGHIDGTGKITSVRRDDISVWYTVKADRSILRYIVEKGSITIDGISLTVARAERDDFSVSVIPHTSAQTTLSQKKIGSVVNLEVDMIAKYVERFMTDDKGITRSFLAENGF